MKRTSILLVALVLAGIATGVGASAISGVSASDIAATLRPSNGEPGTLHRKVVVDGGEWALTSRANTKGETCISQSVPGEGIGTTCIDPARIFAGGRDVLVMPGARQNGNGGLGWDNIWLHGFARPNVATLEVVNMDCSVESIGLDDEGAFMHIVNRAKIQSGSVPYKVIARNTSGDIVHEQDVSILIDVPYNAKRAGVAKPSPRAECR